jgi:hypothetical protein
MLRILGNPKRACDGLTRRELLLAGGWGALGLGATARFRCAEGATQLAQNGPEAKAKSVICLFLFGGMSQLDTFDMKPDASIEVRGEYKSIASNVPGTQVCELLPLLSQRMDRLALVRSVTSDDANHNTGLILTGHHSTIGGTALKGTNPGIPLDRPFFMSVVEHVRQRQGRLPALADLPNQMCVPNRLGLLEGYNRTGPFGGILGAQYDPVCTRFGQMGQRLYQPGGVSPETLDFTPAGASLGAEITLEALARRQGLLDQFDRARRELDPSPGIDGYSHARKQAFELLTSGRMRRALDLRAEPADVRERYGWNLFGQSVLLSRRFVEAGVPLVTAVWDCTKEDTDVSHLSWDTHWDHFKACRGWLLPGLDRALSALLDDLSARSMLDDTLIVVLSEMGRTPKINGRSGRDHWVGAYSALFAGAGIRGGSVHGSTDKLAAYVASHPVSPKDLLATIYHCAGIGPETVIFDRQQRSLPLYGDGSPIRGILA